MTSVVNSLEHLAAKAVIDMAAKKGAEIDMEGFVDPMNKRKVIVLLGVDTTASMQSVIEHTKDTASAVETKLKSLDLEVEVRVASVNDWTPLLPIDKQDSPVKWDVDISEMIAEGGGDTPEAYSRFISEACDIAVENSDKDDVRFIILMGDAYAHGMPPVQGVGGQRESYLDGDPCGATIPSVMQKMRDANVTFIHVMTGAAGDRSNCWAAANAKATDGVVIPMEMTDMDKVPNILGAYISSQTSMAMLCKKKMAELEGKTPEDISEIITNYMKELDMKVSDISETLEHTASDEFISIATRATSAREFYRDFSNTMLADDELSSSYRSYAGGRWVTPPTLTGRNHSATVERYKPDACLPAIRRATSIAMRTPHNPNMLKYECATTITKAPKTIPTKNEHLQ